MAYHPPPQQRPGPPQMSIPPLVPNLPPGMPPGTNLPPGIPPPPVPPSFTGMAGFPPPPMPPVPGGPPPSLPPSKTHGLMGNAPPGMAPISQSSSNSTHISKGPSYRPRGGLLSTPKEGQNRENRENHAPNPTTTVFVGNITERASDAMIRQILMKCGLVVSWKRVQGANGKLQAFGFCEYSDPEASLRAIRLLHNLQVGDKTLVVKVDAKTKTLLDDYKAKKKEEKKRLGVDRKEDGEADDDDDDLDDQTLIEDHRCKKTLDSLLADNYKTLSGEFDPSFRDYKPSHSGKEENLEGLDMDNAKKSLVSREIRSFRDSYRKEDRKRDEDKDKRDKDIGRDDSKGRDRKRDRERSEDRDKRGRSRERERSRDRDRDYDRDRDRTRDKGDTDRDKDRDRDRDKDRDRDRDRDRDSHRDYDEEDAMEKRRQERRLRERDLAYQEKLKVWEQRERKKTREYEREFEKEQEKKDEQARERKHLQEFLEDYDDDRDDPKFYKSSQMSRRRRDREIEQEADERDRQRELEEIEEIRKRLVDVDVEQAPTEQVPVSMENDRDEEMAEAFKPTLQPTFQPAPSHVEAAPVVRSPSPEPQRAPVVVGPIGPPKRSRENGVEQETEPPTKKAFGFEMKLSTSLPTSGDRKKLESVFGSQDEEAVQDNSQRRKLVPLDYDEESATAGNADVQSAEDKKRSIKSLIERIPTAKEELFAYNLEWSIVDQTLVERRIRPWINKKIVEYIGEEEPTLTEFICSKVLSRSAPKSILDDVSMVLDEEAEVFVVKMWRLLIYETEAKKIGLVK